jgi:hypothetical protein
MALARLLIMPAGPDLFDDHNLDHACRPLTMPAGPGPACSDHDLAK